MSSKQQYADINPRPQEMHALRAYIKELERKPWSAGRTNAQARLRQLEREEQAERLQSPGDRQVVQEDPKPWRRRGPVTIRNARFKDRWAVIPKSERTPEQQAAVQEARAANALSRGEPVYAEVRPHWRD